ncbi:MAG: thiamine pyrophosphate-binding protein, partial [Gemmatimonadales bacterium]
MPGGNQVSEMLTGAQMLCCLLEEQGVEVVFGYPGGAIMPLYHALPEYPRLRHVLVRHEQAAAHAADGYARASGRPGVCVATSGPGATNLVTGLATAQLDSSPVVAITGQVPRAMIGRDAFQETDIIGITLPLTKHSVGIRDISELPDKVREAFAIATEGRPGPVLIDIPKDVQNQRAAWRPAAVPVEGRPGASPVPTAAGDDLGTAVRLIAEAERPLLLCGRGVILSGAYAEVDALAEKTGMPVITTLLGIS